MTRRRRLGFTLIELLVVLSIIGIAASLVGPVALQQYERSKVTQEREQLLRLLDDLQFQAYTEFKSIHLMTKNNQMIVKTGSSASNDTIIAYFNSIEFKDQSIDLNSHGFWSNDFFYWFEASNERSVALNMPRIEPDTPEASDASR
ncbi:type II secretion system protein [Pseudidiomarina homiensis]|uniref:type II secretion system protein n=1 Tax=Pseudidiomarina homiensis TaxID=364198 RepID=UPI00215B6F2C|nr:type II secretion system GspH family protein [Pseudidiomarina homiensis]